MGISIQQRRVKIGCNKSLFRSKNLHWTSESPLTSPTSSTRSRHAAGLSALFLLLALLCSPISLQLQKKINFTSDLRHQYLSLNQPCPAKQERSSTVWVQPSPVKQAEQSEDQSIKWKWKVNKTCSLECW